MTNDTCQSCGCDMMSEDGCQCSFLCPNCGGMQDVKKD